MGKFSQKMMGNEVGHASVYAKPHTMRGGKVNPQDAISGGVDPNTLKAADLNRLSVPRVSTGDPAKNNVKTTGIKMRGAGCATKGTMSRGPMA